MFNVGRHIVILPETLKLDMETDEIGIHLHSMEILTQLPLLPSVYYERDEVRITRRHGLEVYQWWIPRLRLWKSAYSSNDYASLAHPALEQSHNHAPRHSSGARPSVMRIFPEYLWNISTGTGTKPDNPSSRRSRLLEAWFYQRAGLIVDVLFQASPGLRACPYASRMCRYDLTSTFTYSPTTQSRNPGPRTKKAGAL
ncbi:hypothetical protein NEUTE1DRAFT_127678 [Neurospora tetrasperma FGSC 2508]|uniref:Uncharacterized protein n=1 Tax=Neurospora tetrasperma (strain FGSC 2508 / ATCC MYA-4615 / P0657) TaxID=510951 RepID=F8MF45_NEUT8|nr:uncharacterized protein NEUTE1DRAFT_127678 [Neurospora tetrasperma FGSC 2508]EGO60899.1 hypothetical protein NEUTE1DRAFT_127678 [Neurospora tetrasperma FGSC 2508]EGZ75103.1 hypothetical protein NEUTE2DRAFT_148323 [Neurospora tetrasperma FGSC 2509]